MFFVQTQFIKVLLKISLFLNMIMLVLFAQAQQLKISELPRQINKKAVSECLPRLQGILKDQDIQDLNNLRVTIERVYLIKPPRILNRNLELKSDEGILERWEFILKPDSNEKNEFFIVKLSHISPQRKITDQQVPKNLQNMSKEQMIKFLGQGEIIKDERVEQSQIQGSHLFTVHTSDFIVQEIEMKDLKGNKKLNCRVLDNKLPLCQCH